MKRTGYNRGEPQEIEVVGIGEGRYLQPDAADAWTLMKKAAEKDGITLTANSAWRSFEHQQLLYDRYEDKLSLWTDSPGVYDKPLRPARPGYSNHHMGVAVDINRSHDDPDGAGPELGPTDKWLEANARKFGYYRTVRGEPWHFEFLGILDEEEGDDVA